MKNIIFAFLLLTTGRLLAEETVNRYEPKIITSEDGRKTWTVYADKNSTRYFYSLPGLGRIKKKGKTSGLKLLENDDGSISGYFTWVPVDRSEDAIPLTKRIQDLYGPDTQVLPLSPSKVSVSWIDLDNFSAEISMGKDPGATPGVQETVRFKVPSEAASYFKNQVVLEKCHGTGNCGQLILVNYRFVMNNAAETIDTFNHAFSFYIEAAPFCELFETDIDCFLR
jgi:hypothetical protein